MEAYNQDWSRQLCRRRQPHLLHAWALRLSRGSKQHHLTSAPTPEQPGCSDEAQAGSRQPDPHQGAAAAVASGRRTMVIKGGWQATQEPARAAVPLSEAGQHDTQARHPSSSIITLCWLPVSRRPLQLLKAC